MGQPGKRLRCLFKGDVPGVEHAGDAGARWLLQRTSGSRSAWPMSANAHGPVPCSDEMHNEEGRDLEEAGGRSSGILRRISQPG
jgi:hypothetical protein